MGEAYVGTFPDNLLRELKRESLQQARKWKRRALAAEDLVEKVRSDANTLALAHHRAGFPMPPNLNEEYSLEQTIDIWGGLSHAPNAARVEHALL
jgi:hypothetical protein